MKHPESVDEIPLADIEIGERHRKEMGDLKSLADSIAAVGLLHPIGVTPDRRLIFGERRLRAVRDILKRVSIEARVFDLDLDKARDAEHAENEERKALTLSERHALLQALEARRQEYRGRPRKSGQLPTFSNELKTKNLPQNPNVNKSRVVEAQEAGFNSDREARRVGEVMDQGTPELIQAMDEGDVSVAAAAVIATANPEVQSHILLLDDKKRQRELRRLRDRRNRFPKPRRPLSDGHQVYLIMNALERLATTTLDEYYVAETYAGYNRAGSLEKIRLAIIFLEKLEKVFPQFVAKQKGSSR